MIQLFDRGCVIIPALVQLARLEGLDVHDKIRYWDMSRILQENWLEQGKLRVEIEGRPPNDQELDLLNKIGCISRVSIPNNESHSFDGAMLLGAIFQRIWNRLMEVSWEHAKGARFDKLYLLGSHRCLKESETLAIRSLLLKNDAIPSNEIEMMKFVLDRDEFVRGWGVDVVPIATPDVKLETGSRPANTRETLTEWRAHVERSDGRFLLVSNQPFVNYQLMIAERSEGYQFVGIGDSSDTNLPLKLFLDNLSKQLYEECSCVDRRVSREIARDT